MTKPAHRILISTLLATLAACGSSKPANTGTGGSGGSGVTTASGGTTGTGGTTSTGGSVASGGTTGTGGSVASGGTTGTGGTTPTPGADGSAGATSPARPDGGGSDVATTTKAITAATGGALTITGGAVNIPAGALAADTTIAVQESSPAMDTPNKDQIVGLIYNFGPNGTKFKTPVELTLPLTSAVPPGKSAVVAFLDTATNVWVPIASNVSGATGAQKVRALTSHFTPFAVLLLSTGGACPATAACGGSLVGAWELVTFCKAGPQETVTVDCKDGSFEFATAVWDLTGTMTIAADNTFTTARTVHADRFVTVPPACIALGNTVVTPKIATCDDLVPGLNKEFSLKTTICSGTVAAGCTCFSPTAVLQTQTGTIVPSGTTYIATLTGSQPGAPNAYCVKGNVLTVTSPTGDVFTAIKK